MNVSVSSPHDRTSVYSPPSYVKAGYQSITNTPCRGSDTILPPWVEKNVLKLVLACDERGDENATHFRVRRAVGVYIKDTCYEREFKKRYPGSWDEKQQIVIPGYVCARIRMRVRVCTYYSHAHTGLKWYDAFFKRMKKHPEYTDIVETYSAKSMDSIKLKYYNTKNINDWYDKATEIICDEWEIAERNDGDGEAELTWTGNKTRILFSDESAFKDRKETARIATAFRRRITR